MAKLDERTLKMMENYIPLHNQGKSVEEIAELFDLDKSSVYRVLDRIAEQNGVSRESLLKRPHVEHTGYEKREGEAVEPIDSTDFMKLSEELFDAMEELGKAMKKHNKQQRKITEQYKVEEM